MPNLMPNGHSVRCRPYATRLYSHASRRWLEAEYWRPIWWCLSSGPDECPHWRVNQAWRTYHGTGYRCDCGTWIPWNAPANNHLSYCPLSIPELRAA